MSSMIFLFDACLRLTGLILLTFLLVELLCNVFNALRYAIRSQGNLKDEYKKAYWLRVKMFRFDLWNEIKRLWW